MTVVVNGKKYRGAVAREINKAINDANVKRCEAFYLVKIGTKIVAEYCLPEFLTRQKLWGAFLLFLHIDGTWVEVQ